MLARVSPAARSSPGLPLDISMFKPTWWHLPSAFHVPLVFCIWPCKQKLLSEQRIFTDTKPLSEETDEAAFVHWNSVGCGSLFMQMRMKRLQMEVFSFLHHRRISCWFAMLSEMANSRFFFSRLIISKIPLLWMALFCEWRPVDSTYSNKPKALRW